MPAFGRGVRTGGDKLWADAAGSPVFAITLESIVAAGCFDLIVVAAPTSRWDAIRDIATAAQLPSLVLVEGGERRQDSVAAAIERCAGHDWISVHDAARPLTPPSVFRAVLEAARTDGATEWQTFRRVTVPLLMPVLSVVFVTMIINVLKVFDIVYALAPESEYAKANVIALAMYFTAFQGAGNFGVGSAIAVFLFLLVIPVLALNIRRFKREA